MKRTNLLIPFFLIAIVLPVLGFSQAAPLPPDAFENVDVESMVDAVTKAVANANSGANALPNATFNRATLSGKELFEKVWEPGKPLHDGADGIGPLFNERSCIACHSQAGAGGGGGVDKNVDILSLANRATPNQHSRLVNYHPGFRTPTGGFLNSIVLHRFGLDGKYSLDDYSEERTKLLRNYVSLDRSKVDVNRLQRKLEKNPRPTVIVEGDIPMIHTQRNSTALFGASLIDNIPDSAIVAEAMRQAKEGKVSGRPAQLRARGSVNRVLEIGKFGWRAQQATLTNFVEGACAVELGLNTRRQQQAVDPRDSRRSVRQADVNEAEILGLASFVGSFKKPREMEPAEHERLNIERGKSLFNSIGCADCHLSKLADVEGIYSDLLLHDMGKSLADPAPARDAIERTTKVLFQVISDQEAKPQTIRSTFTTSDGVLLNNYYGFEQESANPIVDLATREKEWRTPPLWGVADSAPYMHDGRAKTLAEAIVYHDGESRKSKIKYLKLSRLKQKALLAFLGTLRAPETN